MTRRRPRIQIIKTNCRRCEKPLFTTSRSIHRADQAHAKYAGICSECITPEEREEMTRAIAGSILGQAQT